MPHGYEEQMGFEGHLFSTAIGPLGTWDEPDLVSLLQRLDMPSRVSRFGSVVSDAALAAHARRALADADWIAALFMDAELCAVVEIYKLGSHAPGVAEAAFIVDPRWRGRGVATALLRASVRWARRAGIETLRMVFSRSNWPMRKLARKGVASFRISDEEISADICVADGVQR
jgi:GNAT superfamily N-acetyltransferase